MKVKKVKSAIICKDTASVGMIFSHGRMEKLYEIADIESGIILKAKLHENAEDLRKVEAIITIWGIGSFSEDDFSLFPNLKAVFHAGGSVKGFAKGFLERNIQVMGAWGANAVPVAEFTLAQIILSNKGYFRNIQSCSSHAGRMKSPFRGRGNFGASVALLGCGQIARKLIDLLRHFHLNVIVVDPYLSDDEAGRLGVEKVSLDECFRRADVVSNHLPNLPELRGIIKGVHFESMRENATFINTGRGTQILENEMAEVLERRPDLTALLDVTDPEPPLPDSPLYLLPNVRISSHIAGSIGDEVVRLADYVISDLWVWSRGEPLRYSVSLEMLNYMA